VDARIHKPATSTSSPTLVAMCDFAHFLKKDITALDIASTKAFVAGNTKNTKDVAALSNAHL